MVNRIDLATERSSAAHAQTATRKRLRHATASLSTGVTLPYVEQGAPDGTPLVMLHGFTDSWHSFEPVLPHLPDRIRAFALTQRGHGDADRPDGSYDDRAFANDVAAWMDHVGLESAVIVGHSLGAHIAQRLALHHPERVRGLVLAGAFDDVRNDPTIAQFVSEVLQLSDPVDREFAQAFQEANLNQPVAPAFLDTVVNESCKLPARVWTAVIQAMMASDLPDRRARITVPTRFVWGAFDAFSPRAAQDRLLATIAASDLLVYANAGHAMHWEEPARFAADLVAFVDRVGENV